MGISSQGKGSHKFLFKVRPFLDAKVSCKVDHGKLTMCNDRPDHFVVRKQRVNFPDVLLNQQGQ